MAGSNEMLVPQPHDVRSEILEELLALRTGHSPGTVLLHMRVWAEPVRAAGLAEDEDGDVIVPRKRRQRAPSRDGEAEDASALMAVWSIETMSCSGVDATGVQLWRAALLMAEFVQNASHAMSNTVIVELGTGVGFVSLVAATSARAVFATDCDVSALEICERNASRQGVLSCAPTRSGNVRVRHFDWSIGLHRDASKDSTDGVPARFQLTHDDLALWSGDIDWILASDVFYDDNIADVFLDALHALMLDNPRAQVIIAAERRVVFSAVTLSEISLGFDTFQSRLCLHSPSTDLHTTSIAVCTECTRDALRFVATRILVDSIPHVYNYERVHTLALWRVHAVIPT